MKFVKYTFASLIIFYILGIAIGQLYLSHFSWAKRTIDRIAIGTKNYRTPPDFQNMLDAKEKKQQFFNYFTPIIADENARILRFRQTLLALKAKHQQALADSKSASAIIDAYANYYGVPASDNPAQRLEELLQRVNSVPRSLVLAQAANESAWGTSRFARTANNYFGQWCFTAGCGLVPTNRAANAKHEVRKFQSPAESVRSYMHNINTHRAYERLREIRADTHQHGDNVKGSVLAEGLAQYSERGAAYIHEIKNIISVNHLEQ